MGSGTGKRGCQKTLDGKIDFANPDTNRMRKLDIDPSEGEAYELIAWSKSLKQKVRLVLHYLPGRGHRLYFCKRPKLREGVCGVLTNFAAITKFEDYGEDRLQPVP